MALKPYDGDVIPDDEGPDPSKKLTPYKGEVIGDTPDASVGDVLKEVGASAIESVGSIAQMGGELVSQGVNAITGEETIRAVNPLGPVSEYIRESMTPGGQAARRDGFKGDITDPGSWALPETGSGMAMGVAQGVGSLAATVGPLAGAKVLGAGSKAMTAVGAGAGAAMTGGSATESARQSVRKILTETPHETLLESVPAYREAIESGMQPDAAKERVESRAALYSGLISAAAGAVGGAVNAKFLADILAKKGIALLLGKVSEKGAVRAATGAVAGGLGEGAQETLEQVGQNVGENVGLGRPALEGATRDTFGPAVLGAAVGGPVGAAGGALSPAVAPAARATPAPGVPPGIDPETGEITEAQPDLLTAPASPIDLGTFIPDPREEEGIRRMERQTMMDLGAKSGATNLDADALTEIRTELNQARAEQSLPPVPVQEWKAIVEGMLALETPTEQKPSFPFITAQAADRYAQQMTAKMGQPFTVSPHPTVQGRFAVHPEGQAPVAPRTKPSEAKNAFKKAPEAPQPATLATGGPAEAATPGTGTQPTTERRADTARRSRVADMTPEELRREILTSSKAGIGNDRAYKEAPKRSVQASLDLDSLKWVNDNMGHEAGDQLIAKLGEALRDANIEGYHVSGDEFVAQFDDDASGSSALDGIRNRLANAEIEVELPDGTTITKKGIGFSYGLGKDLPTAEIGLQSEKSARERSGQRAGRGAEPSGVSRRAAAGQQDQGGAPAAEVTTEGAYTDGGKWKKVYRAVKRSDGGFALVRTVTDDDGARTEHLTMDGTWAKGEPSTVAVSGARQASGPEHFPSAEHALDQARSEDAPATKPDSKVTPKSEEGDLEQLFDQAAAEVKGDKAVTTAKERPDRERGEKAVRALAKSDPQFKAIIKSEAKGAFTFADPGSPASTEALDGYLDAKEGLPLDESRLEKRDPNYRPGTFNPVDHYRSGYFSQKFGRPTEVRVQDADPVEPAAPTIDEAAHEAATSPENDKKPPTPAQIDAGNYEKGHTEFAGMPVSIENSEGSWRYKYNVKSIEALRGALNKAAANRNNTDAGRTVATQASMRLQTALDYLKRGDPKKAVENMDGAEKGLLRLFPDHSDVVGRIIEEGWHVKLPYHYGYFLKTVAPDKDHVDVAIKPGTPRDYKGPVYVIAQNKDDGTYDEPKVFAGWHSQDEARAAYVSGFDDAAKAERRIRGVRTFSLDAFKKWVYNPELTKQSPVGAGKKAEPPAAPRMTREEIVAALSQGRVKIGPFDVRIEQGANQRYYAKVTAPDFNTVIETPATVDAAGIVSFYDRVAEKLGDMWPKAGQPAKVEPPTEPPKPQPKAKGPTTGSLFDDAGQPTPEATAAKPLSIEQRREAALKYLREALSRYVEGDRDVDELFKGSQGASGDGGRYEFRGGKVEIQPRGEEATITFSRKQIEEAWAEWVAEAKRDGLWESTADRHKRENRERAAEFKPGDTVGVNLITVPLADDETQQSPYVSGEPFKVLEISPERAVLEVTPHAKEPVKVAIEPRWLNQWYGEPYGTKAPPPAGPEPGQQVTLEEPLADGGTAKFTLPADQAMKTIDERITGVEALLQCLD